MASKEYSKAGCCVDEADTELCLCANSGLIDLVSSKWTLPIIWLLGKYGSLRFNDISKRLNNVNPNTLSIRLDELQGIGLITRQKFSEIPPRVEYSLTGKGRQLEELTKPLLTFALGDKAIPVKFIAKKPSATKN